MAFDFYSKSYYKIDYDALYSELMFGTKGKLFTSIKKRENYLTEWINLLKQSEQKSDLLLKTMSENDEYADYYINSENFQLPFLYLSQTISIHFNISKTLSTLPTGYSKKSHLVHVDQFLGNQPVFLWTPVDFDSSRKIKQHTPIIAVPFLNIYSDYLIIDGNTRLTSWINNKEKIPTLIIDINSLVENKLFCSEFDMVHYIFRYDLISLGNLFNRKKITDQQLFESSFLNNKLFRSK